MKQFCDYILDEFKEKYCMKFGDMKNFHGDFIKILYYNTWSDKEKGEGNREACGICPGGP